MMLAHEMSAMPAMIGTMPASAHTGTAKNEHGVISGKQTRYAGGKTDAQVFERLFYPVTAQIDHSDGAASNATR